MLRLIPAGLAALLLWGCSAEAEEPAAPPPALELTGRVVDAADILSDRFEAQITAQIETLEAETGVQLVVATTPDLQGRDIGAYSFDLANAWGIGSAERNDGLMLLVAPNERQARIEVGLGLETTVQNAEAAAILEGAVLPEFRKGDYEAGIARGVDQLVREVSPAQRKEAA